MPAPALKELLEVATEAAYLAGRRTLAYFNAGVPVEIKSDNTPVTCADREAEQVIRKHITKYYPDHAIVGEEGGSTPGDKDYKWILDPIDGTKSFIYGVPLYGVLVGLEVKGVPSVGAIYMPGLDEMVNAATGLGCKWNGRIAKVSNVSKLEDAMMLCTSTVRALKRSDAFETLANKVKYVRGWGDCYGYLLVATGRAEIMLDPAMNPWDCAPMLPILQEAGGWFGDWSGKNTIWGKDGVATNGALQKQVLEVLSKEKLKS